MSDVIENTDAQKADRYLRSTIFRPKSAVKDLRDESIDPLFAPTVKAIAIIELTAWNWLDQEGRTRRAPGSPKALHVIRSKHALRARLAAAAGILDLHSSLGTPDLVGFEMLSLIRAHGGFGSLVNGNSARVLLRNFKELDRKLKYVVLITACLVRCAVHPDRRAPETIEDAKAFVCKWEDDCGLSKISKIWEDFKLAAPYVYAFHLERSFRPLKTEYPGEALDWALGFVKSQRRLSRFLGHAAFAMDILKRHARDQRESDFNDVPRVVPPAQPFNNEEWEIIKSVDRTAPLE